MKRAPILHTGPVRWLYKVTQRVNFPGSHGISLYAVLEFFVRSIAKKDLQNRASALSFTFFLALFPTVIFFFTLIAYLPFTKSPDEILFFISGIIPKNAYLTIRETLEDILKTQRGGLLSIGFLTAMYFSTNGFHSLMDSLNKYSHISETRSFWKQRLVAIGMAFFISILILISVTSLTVGNIVIHWLDKLKYFPHGGTAFLLSFLNYAIVAGICLTIVSAIFYWAPAKVRPWRFLSAGSIFTCVVILITTTGFSFYVSHFDSYNKVYGSIGVLIVIMMLIYINTFILLLGYELNVAIDLAKAQESKNKARRARSSNRIIYLEDTIPSNDE